MSYDVISCGSKNVEDTLNVEPHSNQEKLLKKSRTIFDHELQGKIRYLIFCVHFSLVAFLLLFILFRSQSIVKVEGKITLSRQQITLEGNDSLCDLEGVTHKW